MRVGVPLCLFMALAARPVAASEPRAVAGVVKDSTGAAVPAALVSLRTPQGTVVASASTDGQGQFRIPAAGQGSHALIVEAPGFARRRLAVAVGEPPAETLVVTLQPEAFRDEVTVTASPGRVDAVETTPQQVNVIGEEDLRFRVKAVIAQSASEEVGIHLQRTSPTMGGIFVRGLTGTKVNVYVDGVRYTTSAQRGGVSTFLNLVEPEAVESVEVLRGPSSAEYGSDALGGSIQFQTRGLSFAPGAARLSGSWSANGASADGSFGSALNGLYAAKRFAVGATLAGRRVNRTRPGREVDSHNAVTRFLGLPSSTVVEDRLPDTAFTQYGGRLKVNASLSPTSQLAAGYLRGQQDGGNRYDQLLGGDGNLVARLKNLMMDLVYARWEKTTAGPFDHLSLGYSFGAQREERVNQGGNGNPRAAINHEPERTVAHGLQAMASRSFGRHALTTGADAYFESMSAPSFSENAVTGATAPRRGRVPDGARYRHGGVFAQDMFEAVPGKLRLNGALRVGAASYEASAADSPLVGGEPLWPDDSYDSTAVTFRVGAVWDVGRAVSLAAGVSRGYRAPDITDLGTFGVTGSGYEVSNREVEGLGAFVGTTADARAVSTGEPVEILDPETSLNYELTLRYRGRVVRSSLTAFLTDIDANVAKQTLILPPGAVGLSLAGEPIVRQLDTGAVFVPVSTNPVLVRANFDDARIYGFEYTLDWQPAPAFLVGGLFTYLHAEDRATGRPPNIEGGTPAPEGWLKVRWAPRDGRRFWVEPYLHAAARQDRLSSLDLDDRRTGAGRSRSSIASFFDNGARARGLVGNGPDGVSGNADDVLLATGETLARVQDRVLGPGVAAAPLFPELPGYAVFGVRGALRLGDRHELLVDVENVGDVNYRGVSWGMDAPGRGVYVRYTARF
jgi:outer membrane receptor protein involved in Fe transport